MFDLYRVRSAAVLLAATAMACSSDPNDPDGGGTAELTVVHASPTVGNIDVRVADLAVVSGLAYGRSSGALEVPAGTKEITVRSGSSEIARFNVNLTPNQGTALTIGADTTQVSPVIPDTGHVVTNRANVRLVNVVGPTTADPTLLSMRLNYPGVSTDSIAVLGLDAKIASHGPLMYFDPGRFRIWFVAQGSTTVLAEAEFDVAAGEVALIVLERNAAGAYAARIVRQP